MAIQSSNKCFLSDAVIRRYPEHYHVICSHGCMLRAAGNPDLWSANLLTYCCPYCGSEGEWYTCSGGEWEYTNNNSKPDGWFGL